MQEKQGPTDEINENGKWLGCYDSGEKRHRTQFDCNVVKRKADG